jgi:lipase maturation factor 1
MIERSALRISNPPPKPLLIWDGDCHFCRHWVERWRDITDDAVEYETSQNAAAKFSEIPADQFRKSVIYINRNGEAFFGAEAVYRALQCRSSRNWLAWSYDHVPGFATLSELSYRIVAQNRKIFSSLTRWSWGHDVRPLKYFWARRWFMRALGLVYLVAFVSLWVQIDGLVGKNGITPVSEFLPAAQEELGSHFWSVLPSLCWFNSSDPFLHFLCGGGVVLSILLIVGIAPAFSLLGLLIFYLSLTIAGQTFLSFQWDILLLETGFLSIFFAPWQLWSSRGREPPVSGVALFLLKFLLFKLMLMSGVVKLTSGDDSWWNLTALDYHYWSQPLPTIFGWWADHGPEWFKKFSVAFCLIVEIIVPFFIWAPRRLRLAACALLVFLQIAIAITGNYCFFNLLTVALCLLLIDDAALRRSAGPPVRKAKSIFDRWALYGAVAVLVITLPINLWLTYTAFKPEAEWPRPLAFLYDKIEPFRVANGYGLFRVMTKDRREIEIEGSENGIEWRVYEFKWKPGEVTRPPGWCAPHQPRLDWQMWFAALGSYRQNPWFVRLMICLLHGNREVTQLFRVNPFPHDPPHYVRALSYRYRFATEQERRQDGAWWKREELGEYLPTISLRDVR